MSNSAYDEDDDEDHRPSPASRPVLVSPRRPRLLRRIASGLGFVIAVLVLTVAIFAFRLSQGPVGLPFLEEKVLQAIGSKLPPGSSFSLQEVALERRAGGLAVSIIDPSLRAGEGRPYLSADAIHVSVNFLSLLRGAVEPTAIEISTPRIALARKLDGHIAFRDSSGGESTRAQGLGLVVGAVEKILDATGSIGVVTASDMSLSLDNLAEASTQDFAPFNLTLRRTASAGGLSIIADGKAGARLSVTTERRDGGQRYVEINARDLSPGAIAAAFVPSGPPPEIDAVVNGTANLRLSGAGAIETGAVNLQSNGGIWLVGPDLRPFQFDEAALRIAFDGKVIKVESARVRAGAGAADFSGVITPPANPDDPTNPIWTMRFSAAGATLAGPNPAEAPLVLDTAVVEAHYDPRTRQIGLDHASFIGPSAGLSVQGSLTFGARAPGIGLAFVASRMPVTAMKRLWPFFSVWQARDWFSANVNGGIVESARLKLEIPIGALAPVNGKIPPLEDKAVDGEFVFSGATVKFVDTMPPIFEASASSKFTGHTFAIYLGAAKLTAGQDTLDISDGRYFIADLIKVPADTVTTFKLSGPAAAVAALMRMPPLSEATKTLAFDPEKVTGTVSLNVSVESPLGVPPTPQSVRYTVTGAVEGMTIEGVQGSRLEDATLSVDLSQDKVGLVGKGTFAGAPATVTYDRAADGAPAVQMSVTLDDKARAKHGFPMGTMLQGPVKVDVDLSGGSDKDGFKVAVDLTGARVNDLLPGWQKAAGKPGKVTLTWLPDADGGGTIKDVLLESGSVKVGGEATIDSSGTLAKASLSPLQIQPGDDARATMQAIEGGVKLSIDGASFDVRGAIRKLLRGDSGATNVDLAVQLDQAVGFNDTAVAGLRLALSSRAGAITKLSATGQLGSAPTSIDLGAGENGEPLIQISSTDAGSLMRFLNYYAKVVGGRVDARITPDLNNARGVVFMRNFAVRGEPALAQFFSNARAVPNEGAGGGVLRPSSNGLADARFSKLRLSFSRTPQRLTIEDGVVWGPEVGAQIAGIVDYGQDRVNIAGTFVPAYALNNLFGQIPILGLLLGGGQYGGLFAVTFRVAGPIGGPTLTVNPLSGIAPGFLRKLFEFQKE